MVAANDERASDADRMLRPAELHRRLLARWPDVLTGEIEPALRLIATEVVDHRGGVDGDVVGIDAWRAKWERMAAPDGPFRDVMVTVEQNVASGEFSSNRYRMSGTEIASGRHYEVYGLDMIRVVDGRLAEHWAIMDLAAMQVQLGESGSA